VKKAAKSEQTPPPPPSYGYPSMHPDLESDEFYRYLFQLKAKLDQELFFHQDDGQSAYVRGMAFIAGSILKTYEGLRLKLFTFKKGPRR
jgi:hypothetical protein